MRIKVIANLSGAVKAEKDQEVTVTAEAGSELIARGLAVEIKTRSKTKSAQKREDD